MTDRIVNSLSGFFSTCATNGNWRPYYSMYITLHNTQAKRFPTGEFLKFDLPTPSLRPHNSTTENSLAFP